MHHKVIASFNNKPPYHPGHVQMPRFMGERHDFIPFDILPSNSHKFPNLSRFLMLASKYESGQFERDENVEFSDLRGKKDDFDHQVLKDYLKQPEKFFVGFTSTMIPILNTLLHASDRNIVIISGSMGSGKTTLARTIRDLLRTKATHVISEDDFTNRNPSYYLRSRVSIQNIIDRMINTIPSDPGLNDGTLISEGVRAYDYFIFLSKTLKERKLLKPNTTVYFIDLGIKDYFPPQIRSLWPEPKERLMSLTRLRI